METKEKEVEELVEEKPTADNKKELDNDKMVVIFVCSLIFILLVGAAIGVYFINI